MIHEVLPVGMLQCNCSVFGDEQTREAIVIDPGDNVEEILGILERHRLRATLIVITHAHIDHVGGAAKLKAVTGASVLMNEDDEGVYDQLDMQASWLGMATPRRVEIDGKTRDGDTVRLGSSDFSVLHTPGHTPGSICLWLPSENKVIAGDTLFRDSIGRTDLPGGDFRKILVSIRDKLLTLPEETLVLPGHGDTTTIGREKEFNYFLQGL
ncbi:MAG TPA: MBL fold metallo-hydrolase [Bryobacteraceae bacterium]|nr:MBL fold metallo-hydrolase [Bryobacteraceae bacterium]